MTSSSHAKEITSYATGNNPITFKLTAKEGMNHISQPISANEAIMKNWLHQMLVPFMVDKKLQAFHGPLADPKSSPKVVAPFFPRYKPAWK